MKRFATVLAACAWASIAQAATDSVTLKVSPSTNTVPATVKVTLKKQVIPVAIPPLMPASAKRNAIEAALAGAGYAVTDDGPGGSSLTVHGLSASETVKLETADSGEALDTLLRTRCGHCEVGFASAHFVPFDSGAQPAIFTAGIVTDVGQLSAQVSAQELSFQTDGPIICQALFQRLAPHAPQYGAQINYAGDRLEVYFDPAYTVTQGGILFGTTSPTPGCQGSAESSDLRRELELLLDDCTNAFPDVFRVQILGEALQTIDSQVPPQTTAPALRSSLLDDLHLFDVPAFAEPNPAKLTLVDLDPMGAVLVRPQGTGQDELRLSGPDVAGGSAVFAGHFVPFDSSAQPAVFTAGIVTDAGVLLERVSATDLGFQTDGPIICQALFQRLAPRAPQYGAQINYAGDRLEIYFDPAYTVTQGGIIFGTTSPSQGCEGRVVFTVKSKRR